MVYGLKPDDKTGASCPWTDLVLQRSVGLQSSPPRQRVFSGSQSWVSPPFYAGCCTTGNCCPVAEQMMLDSRDSAMKRKLYDAIYECMLRFIAANPPLDGTAEIRVGVFSLALTANHHGAAFISKLSRCSLSCIGHQSKMRPC